MFVVVKTALFGGYLALEETLRAQEQEVARKLKETDQMKGDLLAMVSHELRTPLTSSASERVEVDAAELLEEAATQARAGACGDRVGLRCDRSLPVRMAPDAVLQILGNLVDNACKYGPEGRPVVLVGERDGSEAVLAVEDHGARGAGPLGRRGPGRPLRVVPGPARRSA